MKLSFSFPVHHILLMKIFLKHLMHKMDSKSMKLKFANKEISNRALNTVTQSVKGRNDYKITVKNKFHQDLNPVDSDNFIKIFGGVTVSIIFKRGLVTLKQNLNCIIY